MIRNIPPARTPIVDNEPVSRSWYDYLLWVADKINGLETTDSGVGSITVSQSNVVIGRASPNAGPAEEIAFTSSARALSDDNSFAEMRETLGLGTAALLDADDLDTGVDATPTLVVDGSTTLVGENSQMLFVDDIVVDGTLTVEGTLIQIDSVQDAADAVDAHEATYDHDSYDAHLASTSNPHSTTVSNLTDTTIGSLTTGQVLQYTGSQWENQTLVAADVSDFDEAAQDAVGGILTDSSTLDFTYDDGADTISADVLDSPLLQGNNSAYHLSRTNHTGTQTASTISDFDSAAVSAVATADDYVLNTGDTMTGALDLSSNNLEGVSLAADNGSDLDHGTYTPTLTNDTNITSSTAEETQWSRVGNTITVSGRVSITVAGTGSTILKISLPIASNLGANRDCCGNGSLADSNTVGSIRGDATNDVATFAYVATTTGVRIWYYIFSYEVV